MLSNVEVSVVSPFFNEAASLPHFLAELREVLDGIDAAYEVILVDDGSTDDWRLTFDEVNWPECRVLQLTKNFGHQSALDAGLSEAQGAYAITLDSDLQHPPSLIPRLLTVARKSGCDVVYAKREERNEDSLYKRWSARLYYRSMRYLTGIPLEESAADFRLMSRFVIDLVNAMPERKIFRLLLPSLGFSSETVTYVASVRRAGASKYTMRNMAALAFGSSIRFSRQPLRLVTFLGLATSALAVFWLIYVIVSWISGDTSTGWPSVMAVTLLTSGVVLFSLGIIGEYIGEIYDGVKERPNFIVRRIHKSPNEDQL